MRPLVDERGFSLAELLVTIGVIAILSIASIPTLLTYWQGATLQAGARELATAINRGRQLALARNTTVSVQLSGTSITMRTAAGLCGTGTLYTGPGTDGNGAIRLTNGMQVSFAGGTCVLFNNLGAAATANTFTVTNPVTNRTRSVVVSPSGQVRVQ